MGSGFLWALTSVNRWLMQKKNEIQKFLLLRLVFIVFFASVAPLKNFTRQEKIFFKNKSCSTNINNQLCQKTKNSYSLTFRDNRGPKFRSKKQVFRTFWPLDGVGEVWKPQKWTRNAQKPLF